MILGIAILATAALASPQGTLQSRSACNIEDFGAKPVPFNSTAAIQAAINACCSKSGPSEIIIPKNVYETGPLTFYKCGGLAVTLLGSLQAPASIDWWPSIDTPQFILIKESDGFTLSGGGSVNGSGFEWWKMRRETPSEPAPYLIKIDDCDGGSIENVQLMNSPKFHLDIDGSRNITVRGLSVSAPQTSPNTDGIDVGNSHEITVQDCMISNGDDGIAIKPGTTNVLVENCTFYYGHGTSIGSLGEFNDGDFAGNITIRNCTFHETSNGARVKTWQGSTGWVRNITFEDILLDRVGNPLRINQYYCPSSQHPKPCINSTTKALNISDVTFRNLRGTQSSGYAGTLLCSDPSPCRNVILDNIQISPVRPPAGCTCVHLRPKHRDEE